MQAIGVVNLISIAGANIVPNAVDRRVKVLGVEIRLQTCDAGWILVNTLRQPGSDLCCRHQSTLGKQQQLRACPDRLNACIDPMQGRTELVAEQSHRMHGAALQGRATDSQSCCIGAIQRTQKAAVQTRTGRVSAGIAIVEQGKAVGW